MDEKDRETFETEIIDARFMYYVFLEDIVNFLESNDLIKKDGVTLNLKKIRLNKTREFKRLLEKAENQKKAVEYYENELEELTARTSNLLIDY